MGARRSQRRSVRYEQDQSGCMWGLISMFDFRHGRTPRKLITDKKHGTKPLSGPTISKNKFELLRNLGENGQGIVEGEESISRNKPSVKKLIEEEMVNEQCPKREHGESAVEEPKVEDEEDDRLRSVIKKAKKTQKKSRDMDTYPNPECSCNQNSADLRSLSGLEIDEIMEEFSRQIHQKGIISGCVKDGPSGEARELLRNGRSDFEEKLRAAIKEFIVQRLTNNGKKLKEDEDQRAQRSSSELVNELELAGSEEELFLKLVQDSESMFLKYVQNLKDETPPDQKLVDAKKSEDLIANHKHRSFFRRKVKSHEKIPANDLDDLNRIVILKPGPLRSYDADMSRDTVPNKEAGDNKSGSSNFFLSEIKRRLKNAMAKQNHEAPSRAEASNKRQTKRGVLEIGGAGKGNIGISSPTKDHFYIERNPKPRDPKTSNHENNNNNIFINNNGLPNKDRISNIYIEAKKHLSELWSSGDGFDLSSRKNPKTLGKILSLPEYGASPVGSPSPGRDREKSFVGSRTRFSSEDKGQGVDDSNSSSPPKESTEPEKLENSQTSVSDDTLPEVEGDETATNDEPSLEEDLNCVKEENFVLDSPREEPCGSSSPRMDEQNGSVPVIFDYDESHFTVFEQDSSEEKLSESSPPGSPSSSLIAKNISDNEITSEAPERPSPVSVLEPIFSEDDIIPKNTTFETLKLTLQPLRIQFEEADSSRPTTDENPEGKGFSDDKDAIFGYVKLAIQASNLDWEQICIKLLSSEQLIENPCSPGKLYPNRLCSDEKLLLDCINEVLVELCLYHFRSSPWVSFTKPTVAPGPSPKSVALETFKGVHRHLLPLPLPRTLEQIVRKDMEKSATWLDARFETEIVGFEMSEAIFEDLIGESIFEDLVEQSMLCYVRAEVEPKESQVAVES